MSSIKLLLIALKIEDMVFIFPLYPADFDQMCIRQCLKKTHTRL